MISAFETGRDVESVIVAPKKSGKTCLLASLGIFHLITEADADCRVIASSKDQASLLYDAARGFVRRSDALHDHIIIMRGYRELRSAHDEWRQEVSRSAPCRSGWGTATTRPR